MDQNPLLSCREIRVFAGDREIVRGVDLDIYPGETHILMGPNGSGKSTLAAGLMGHPLLRREGEILLDGKRVTDSSPDELARAGLFLGFQYPVAVPGVTVAAFLREALRAVRGGEVPAREFRPLLLEKMDLLAIPREFAGRYLNDGFSGGEKKRCEILQLLLLEPRVALLDEIDSGLDIDALKVVARGIDAFVAAGRGLLLVTHYRRILEHLRPDRVHVFTAGRIALSGGPELAARLEAEGYERFGAAAAGAGRI